MTRALSGLERLRLTVGSAALALADPKRADMVALVGDLTSGTRLQTLCARLRNDTKYQGQEMIRTLQPVRFPPKGDASLAAMRKLPDGSLGREYAKFMDRRRFSPESRDKVMEGYVDGGKEEEWVLQRYRDVHDLWHVLTGMPTTLLGEIGQKWFEAVHTGLPVATMAAVSGPVRLRNRRQVNVLVTELIPWAVKCGNNAHDLLSIRYEDYLEKDLNEVRENWGISTPGVDFSALKSRNQ